MGSRTGILAVAGAIALSNAVVAKEAIAQEAPRRPPISVTTAQATTSSLPYEIDSIGSVQAIASIQMRSRVDAQVESIAVPDGATVKKGDVLVKLDSRQISAQLKQAQAQLARDQAQLEQNLRDVKRYTELVEKKATPQINLDNSKTATLATKAQIAGDEAAIESLKVQLSYYTILAPVSGKVGTFSLRAGNMVRANDNTPTGVLVTINQIAPIYVALSIPQRYLADLRAAMKGAGALVEARPQGSSNWIQGKVAVLDNTIDPATGMLVARGEFANRDEALWPGQLCDVRVRLRMDDNLTTVPREAVQVGQKGNYIFVANGDKAALRTVKIGREQGGRTIVLEGVKPGETIVVEGANLLRDGASIAVRQPQKPAAKPAAKPSAS